MAIETEWPSDYKRRRIVMVLERKEIVALQYEDGCEDLLNNGELYLLDTRTDQTAAAVRRLFAQELAVPGATLVQNPFERDSYQEVSVASERFALDKYQYFSQFCALLGARKLRVEERHGQARTERNRYRAGIKVEDGGADSEIGKAESDRFRREISLEDTFEGGRPNLDQAKSFLYKRGLSNDQVMLGLLEAVGSENKITSRELELDLSIETQKCFDVMVSIRVPEFLELQADIHRVSCARTQFRLTVSVEF